MPGGGDTYAGDPRRQAFKEYYCNPESPTFGNALKSALKAGFAKSYAEKITASSTDWFGEIIRDASLLSKAEQVLSETLEMETELPIYTSIGALTDPKTKKEIKKHDAALLRIKSDNAKFVAERIGKDKYSKEIRHAGPGGGPLSALFEAAKEIEEEEETEQTAINSLKSLMKED